MRDYQSECIKVIQDTFVNHERQLIQLPTGAGKTWIFSNYLSNNSDSALVLCPTRELQDQIINALNRFGITSVSKKLSTNRKNYVLTYASLTEASLAIINRKGFDHIVIDEAHHSHCGNIVRLLQNITFSPKILGLTATPERLDQKDLLQIFEHLTYKKNIYDMIKEGYLADIEAYKIKTNQNISKRSSDFRQIELRLLDNESRNGILLKTYEDNCAGLKTLIFCLNVDHAKSIASHLKLHGYNAGYVHGEMNKADRKRNLDLFKTGEIEVLTNCQLLTEGFDEPSIEAIIIARPTSSKSLYCQMIGRGLRITENKKTLKLYELTDNNHKICTFNVACGFNNDMQRDYKPGIKLTELQKELETISLEDIEIEKEKISLFLNEHKKVKGNSINILKSKFMTMQYTHSQLSNPPDYSYILEDKDLTQEEKIYIINWNSSFFLHEPTFLEYAFMKWRTKLWLQYKKQKMTPIECK